MNDVVVGEIARGLDAALAGTERDRAGSARAGAEDAVWAEFTTVLGQTFDIAAMPTGVGPAFRCKESGITGWFDACIAFVGEALKTDEKFAKISTATHPAELGAGDTGRADAGAGREARGLRHEAGGRQCAMAA